MSHNQPIALQGQPIQTLPLTFLDLETTGLSPIHTQRICEVALLRVQYGLEKQCYTTLVNPERSIDPGAFAVNGISPDMVNHAPRFADITDRLLALIGDSVLVAHNAPFDMGFLKHEFARVGRDDLPNPVIDTLILARQLFPERSSHSLQTLAFDLGLPLPDHRAMSDVLALEGLFTYLLQALEGLHITKLDEVLRYQRGLLPGDPELQPPPMIAQAMQEHRLLRIVYHSLSTPTSHERMVQPLELAIVKGKVYLRAYCHLRQDFRSFALEKIESMELGEWE